MTINGLVNSIQTSHSQTKENCLAEAAEGSGRNAFGTQKKCMNEKWVKHQTETRYKKERKLVAEHGPAGRHPARGEQSGGSDDKESVPIQRPRVGRGGGTGTK